MWLFSRLMCVMAGTDVVAKAETLGGACMRDGRCYSELFVANYCMCMNLCGGGSEMMSSATSNFTMTMKAARKHGRQLCVVSRYRRQLHMVWRTLMPKVSSAIPCVHARTGEVATPLGLHWGGR